MPRATVPALKPAPATAPQATSEPAQAPAEKKQEDSSTEKATPAETPQAETQPKSDAVGDLVVKAESEYQTGLANYHAGKTDDAKHNFDNALNSLLSSNFDVRSDERLQKEFDRIVQGVNELYPGGTTQEADAAQEPQQKSEPAPIDTTNEIAPAADAGTKAKAEADLKKTRSDLPLMMTDQVAGYIAYFSNSNRGRGVFERAYARSGRYHDMIVSTLKQEGVPQDLIYLAQAESGFHPHAVSRVGARGIWQFMAGRGLGYGLHHNMYVDDRQDPEKSTRAAARHLKDLYNQFGDWYLAMAAYNSGPGTVQAAVKRTGYADFWELYNRNVLPRETKNYVPIILAVTIMTKNPSQYGLDSVVMEKPDDYDTVTLDYPVDLRLVSDCVGDYDRRITGSESEPVAPEHSAHRIVPASYSGRDQGSVRNRHRRHSARQAPVVALSHGSFRRHDHGPGAHLSHHRQADRRSQPPRQSRTRTATPSSSFRSRPASIRATPPRTPGTSRATKFTRETRSRAWPKTSASQHSSFAAGTAFAATASAGRRVTRPAPANLAQRSRHRSGLLAHKDEEHYAQDGNRDDQGLQPRSPPRSSV